jgi:hypothetical protein
MSTLRAAAIYGRQVRRDLLSEASRARTLLGVHELETRQLADEAQLAKLRRKARLGERFRAFARSTVFETLMREHYLRGLRDGLTNVHHV